MIIDRSAAKAALLAKFTNLDVPPFPGAVAMTCSECDAFIAFVSPPLPPNGRTVCTACGDGRRRAGDISDGLPDDCEAK